MNIFLKKYMTVKTLLLATLLVSMIVFVPTVLAAEAGLPSAGSHGIVSTLLWIAVILLFAKLSMPIERIGQSPVLGELIIGIVLGNAFLLGITWFEPIKTDAFIPFLAELGVIILLFQVGLESNINEMKEVGLRALLVATIGVIVPFVLGTWLVGPWLLPGLSSNAYLFLGAALTATSVGITARVFQDFKKIKTPEATTVLAAAAIDDVMGLIILAVVSAIVTLGAVSIGVVTWIIAKAVLFLLGAIVLGQLMAPRLGRLFSKIHTGTGMKFTLAISFALLLAYLSGKIGLAPIIGAFAAGLILDPVHFSYFKRPKIVDDLEDHQSKNPNKKQVEELNKITAHHSEQHVNELIEPVAYFLVPIFFVVTGMNVRLDTLLDPKVLTVALGITAVAVIGKYISGFAAGPVNKQIVGFGMVPRGEVGLIFATMGKSLGVVSEELFSVIVIMVILTTLLTPPILSLLLKKN